jgi:hypothetical protein
MVAVFDTAMLLYLNGPVGMPSPMSFRFATASGDTAFTASRISIYCPGIAT